MLSLNFSLVLVKSYVKDMFGKIFVNIKTVFT